MSTEWRRTTLSVLAATALAVLPSAAGAAGDPAPTKLTDMGALQLAEPTVPGPSREASLIEIGHWAIDNGALGMTYVPETETLWILLPQGVNTKYPKPTAIDVRVQEARYSEAALNDAEDAVISFAEGDVGKKYTFALDIDARLGALAVRTNAPTTLTEPFARLSKGAVIFEESAPIEFKGGVRHGDTSPHWGGASISGAPGGCSAGPTVVVGSTRYGTTAGHCGPNGTTWSSGSNAYGYTHVNKFGTGYDVARIAAGSGAGTYGPRIFHGDMVTAGSVKQVGAGDPMLGITVWSSSKWGSISSTVTSTTTSTTINGVTIYGLFTTNQANTNQGSSGGAVHTVSGSNAGVRGIVSAGGPGTMFASKWSIVAGLLGVDVLL